MLLWYCGTKLYPRVVALVAYIHKNTDDWHAELCVVMCVMCACLYTVSVPVVERVWAVL